MPRAAPRLDVVVATALAVLTVASRLPYRARMLYNWDAVQFALALREYDIVKHQPHPPGYILYVGLGRLVDAWLDDPAAAYVLMAVLFSGLTTFVVYLLALTVYDRSTAVVAATLLAVSPLFWFYGSVGLTYAGEALGATTVAYFAFRALKGRESDAWLAAGSLGLASGLRQPLLILLFPLWLVATVAGHRRVRTVAIGLAVLALAVLAWLVPMIWLTGGVGRYLAASLDLAERVVKPTSIVAAPLSTILPTSRHLLESILVGLGPLVLAAGLVPWYVRRHGWRRGDWFLAGWMVTPVLVYTLVHFGQAGYVLTFLPALVILLSRVLVTALDEAARRASPGWRMAATTATVSAIMLVNGSFFVSARPQPREVDRSRPTWAADGIFSWTAAALREREAVVQTLVGAIRGLYAPRDTLVITELGNPRSYPWLRHAVYYLPEYAICELRVGDLPPGYYAPRQGGAMARVPETTIRVPSPVRRLVWFVDHWDPSAARPAGLEEIALPHGRYLYVLTLTRLPLTYSGYTFVGDDPRPRAREGG